MSLSAKIMLPKKPANWTRTNPIIPAVLGVWPTKTCVAIAPQKRVLKSEQRHCGQPGKQAPKSPKKYPKSRFRELKCPKTGFLDILIDFWGRFFRGVKNGSFRTLKCNFRARLRGRNQGDRESPNADFRRKLQILAASPLQLVSRKFKYLEGAGSKTAGFGLRHLWLGPILGFRGSGAIVGDWANLPNLQDKHLAVACLAAQHVHRIAKLEPCQRLQDLVAEQLLLVPSATLRLGLRLSSQGIPAILSP